MSEHTPGPWRFGKPSDSVVSDEVNRCATGHADYYGGYLIAESIQPSNRPIIAAAPLMLAALQAFIALDANFSKDLTWARGIVAENGKSKPLAEVVIAAREAIAVATGGFA